MEWPAYDLLCVLKASLASWIKESYHVAAAHIAHFVDTVVPVHIKYSISYSTIAGLVTLDTEKFHTGLSKPDSRYSFELEPI